MDNDCALRPFGCAVRHYLEEGTDSYFFTHHLIDCPFGFADEQEWKACTCKEFADINSKELRSFRYEPTLRDIAKLLKEREMRNGL